MKVRPSSLTENLLEFIEERFLSRFHPLDLDLLKNSCAFAEKHYANVIHPTTKQYTEYILLVAKYLIELGANSVLVSAAVICLSPSVTKQVVDDLKSVFKNEHELLKLVNEVFHFSRFEWNSRLGYSDDKEPEVRQAILKKMYLLALGETNNSKDLRDLPSILHFQKKERQAENLIRMLLAAIDIRVLIIKLVDRLYFMQLLKNLESDEKEALHYILLAKITLGIYAPLAERLGLWQLKSELEDMSFRLLDFEKYKSIAQQLNIRKQERNENLNSIISMVKALLDDYGIQADIFGRAKHIYGIYKKMEAKQLALNQINDLLGIRIIVDNHEECKDVQDIIHDNWPPVTSFYNGEVGINYILYPKENGYQSLHTTIIIESKILEVQIRTHEMNEIAEYGSAAVHWRYKEDKAYRRGKTPSVPGTKDRIWNEKLTKVRKNLEDGGEENVKQFTSFEGSLSQDWVYAITPNGHVVDLAAGATPLDFAYRIHTDLGHGYTGAIVSGLSVRMNYTLRNGDTVEINTSPNRKGPSPHWLSKRSLDAEQKDPYLDEILKAGLKKDPPPQWRYQSENVGRTMNKRRKDKKDEEIQAEKQYMFYVFARTHQARSKIQNWLNKQKTDEQVKRSIKYEWYSWFSWDDIKQSSLNRRYLVSIPREAGVYEVRHIDRNPDERMIIGKADNLESRIREELVKGDKTFYPKKQQILAEVNGDTSKLLVRWATTDFNAELESMLLSKYKKRFKGLPKYIDRA